MLLLEPTIIWDRIRNGQASLAGGECLFALLVCDRCTEHSFRCFTLKLKLACVALYCSNKVVSCFLFCADSAVNFVDETGSKPYGPAGGKTNRSSGGF